MKKLMFAISLAGLLGLGASAAVQSANTFGVLKVESDKKETIVCVPWVAVGTGSNPISVADLVMTSNLTVGDTLYYYDNTAKGDAKYKAWELVEGKTWSSPKMVTSVGVSEGTEAAAQTANRGDALILVRQNPTSGDPAVATPIYLYGQYTATEFTGQTLTLGAWNLIAYPNTSSSPLDLNSLNWQNVGDADYINLHNAAGYAITLKRFSDGNTMKWGRKVAGTVRFTDAVVQPGQGAWYVSKATSGANPSYSVAGSSN